MELGGPYDEMVFDNFDHLEEEIDTLSNSIRKRKMMTQGENHRLKVIEKKIHMYTDIDPARREKALRTVKDLLKTYYSYYNG